MKYNRNDAAKNAKSEAGNRKRALLRVGSAVLCAAVVGTMFGAADNLGYKGFAPVYAAAEEGSDLFSDFFGTNNTGEQTQQAEQGSQAEQNSQGEGSFGSFFESGSTTAPADSTQSTPATAAPATSREAKYAGSPPALQQKFMTNEYYYANPDFVGYLTSGVSVSEPVPYSRDNEYYLTHNFLMEEDVAGAAFMDARCSLWPRSQQIVIHGHNQKDKTIFGSLDDMRKESNLKEHPIVEFDTIYEDGTYVIYAAFNASMNTDDSSYFNVERYDFDTQADFDSYIAEVRERSMFDIPIDVNYEDELLTLVTCSYYQDNGRFLLFARRLRANETVESVSALVQQAEQVKEH